MRLIPKDNLFQAPLNPKDTVKITVGCRRSNELSCGKNGIPNICAYARSDGMCMEPPKSWEKQFKMLKLRQILKEREK